MSVKTISIKFDQNLFILIKVVSCRQMNEQVDTFATKDESTVQNVPKIIPV
jgi:hypothetical protein